MVSAVAKGRPKTDALPANSSQTNIVRKFVFNNAYFCAKLIQNGIKKAVSIYKNLQKRPFVVFYPNYFVIFFLPASKNDTNSSMLRL